MGFATDAIHVGQEPDPATGAIVAPIYQTSTYVQEELGKTKGYDYARTNHPNRKALERTMAKLEGGTAAYVFTSGMAAIDTVFRLLRPGDHVVVSEAVYGGVFRLSTQFLVQFGLEFSFVDTSSLEVVRRALKPNTKMIYVETPTNPTMIVSDIAGIAGVAREKHLTLVVDNTFLSPYFQRPIALGAHIVVHSMTKYLNGHSDAVGGAVILSRPEDAERIYFLQRSAGAGLAPMDCFLVSRGIKTLAVRMAQHDANGMELARYLEGHQKVQRVLYPGLQSHPQHELARRQQSGFGAMLSFDVSTLDAARTVLNRVKLCALAESLGGVETLISHPASMTHASIPPEVRKHVGITDGLVRLSVGIENAEDLVADLNQALKGI
ncbi:MAG TPA: PLP-dependent aspartate aminotransferase family protein [Methylomirabilota bacterium]|jgi:cystathionine gamma-lyase/cystathionine beta-lyase/cystathionine gamma-lyase/homocysteine desulfhydrase|nr:PLP-dependent aspartate aminotransferase family protein [Methylomirabilota bacterium]